MQRKSVLTKRSVSTFLAGTATVVVGAWATHWLGPRSESPLPIAANSVTAHANPTPTLSIRARQAAPPRPTVAAQLQASAISLDRWQHLSKNLPLEPELREKIFRDFLGERMVWEGYVSRVNDHRRESSPRQAFTLIMYDNRAALDAQQPFGPPFVRCWFPADAATDLEALRPGQWLVVRGTLANPVLLGSILCTDLNACELVAAGEERDTEQTARR